MNNTIYMKRGFGERIVYMSVVGFMVFLSLTDLHDKSM